LLHLHGLRVRIELAHEAVSVLLGRRRYVSDKGLDEVSAGAAQRFRPAEVCGICLNKRRIEVVLADQKAKSVPQPRLTVVCAIMGLRLLRLLIAPGRTRGIGS
jgi:hypothetical protein